MHSGCCSIFEVRCKNTFDNYVDFGRCQVRIRKEDKYKKSYTCIIHSGCCYWSNYLLLFTGCFGEPMPVRYGYSASLPNDMLTNGIYQSKSFVYAGDRIKYTCAAGTIPVGGNQVTCLTNGKWEKPTFSCQGIF